MRRYYANILGEDDHITGRIEMFAKTTMRPNVSLSNWWTATPLSYGNEPERLSGSNQVSKAANLAARREVCYSRARRDGASLGWRQMELPVTQGTKASPRTGSSMFELLST